MTAVRRVGIRQRRTRLALAHRLAGGSQAAATPAGVVDVGEAMVALHATDPATVFLSVLARCPDATVDTVATALHTERAMIRLLAMRRTVWVVPREQAPVLQAACGDAVAATARRTLVEHLGRGGVADPAGWLATVQDAVLAALARRGEATASELVADVPELATRIELPDARYTQNATSRVLLVLAAEGHLVRGEPLGSWTSTRYRWTPAAAWWPRGRPVLDPAAAAAELAGRWLAAFGPAPVSDLRWWAGWTLRKTMAALAAVGGERVDLDGVAGVALPGQAEADPEPAPWVALLPALDPTPMGWQQRDWFLGEHRAALFDRTGNIGPTVWCDGRIVGGWAQRADGGVAVRLLEDIGAATTAEVGEQAERLAARIGPVRVTPRFRTPLERELAG